MMRPIIICADDYGCSDAISRAILDLAARRRISATSCMTASPHWRDHGPWLADVRADIDIGLHITLVDEAPLTRMPNTASNGVLPGIGTLILKSYLGQLDLTEIEAEIRAQAAAFEAVMGFAPQHLDGHLHTHVLPGIRDVVLTLAQSITPRPWVRNISERFSRILKRGVAVPKAAFLSALGAGIARSVSMPMNDGFSGIHDFSPDSDYARLFERFVSMAGRRHLILCHPGEPGDEVAHARVRGGEYAFLGSAAFLESLKRHDMRVGRFAETV
jgi:predicted glycoside hydrolase/deacetylase ChbG (UPF0249 family)